MKRVPANDVAWQHYFRHEEQARERKEFYYKTALMFEEPAIQEKETALGMNRLKDAFITAFIAFVLALPLAGARTMDGLEGLTVEWHLTDVAIAAGLIFFGRLLMGLIADGFGAYVAPVAFIGGLTAAYLPLPSHFLKVVAILGCFAIAGRALIAILHHPGASRDPEKGAASSSGKSVWAPAFAGVGRFSKKLSIISILLFLFLLALPFLPFTSRYMIDVATSVFIYIMLAWGLNITVGYAGLLDLGYVGFYALGAYSFALLAHYGGIGFWFALPLAGLVAAVAGFLLGFPVLRLRGDYFAIVTLGFGEIVRLVLINWTTLTGGPNGISAPHPTLFGTAFDPAQRVMFLYYIIFALALLTGLLGARLRRLPLGRAWEAFREDEIATAALGVNRTRIKLAAYSLSAMIAGLAGAFFATRQGFISPESFTFTETATILAIVILGGVGHPLGIVMAALFIIGMPELFRELEQYRMLAFGAGMVLIMIWRPGGLMTTREPTVKLQTAAAK